jgi:hypothetical protein
MIYIGHYTSYFPDSDRARNGIYTRNIVDPTGMGHNTDFLTKAANNMPEALKINYLVAGLTIYERYAPHPRGHPLIETAV